MAVSQAAIAVCEKCGEDYELDKPFHVLATQNPIEQGGTYPLPEAQLDRFLVQIDVPYPTRDAERDILIEVEVANGGVAVTITDHDAAEFDVTKDRSVDTGASLRERKPGGLGLHLIQHMVDTLEYDYRGGRSRIRFSKEPEVRDV